MIKFLIIIGLVLVSCRNHHDYKYITKQFWQHDSGARPVGNFLDFKNFTLQNDTLFLDNKPLGKIVKEIRSSDELIIFSFKERKNGIYINSAQFTK
jgi:hypothetical protein